MPWSRDLNFVSSGHVIPISISTHPSLPTELPIPFILRSYRLFHNTMMSDLPTDQPAVEVMAVAWGEKRLLSSTDLLGAQ